ncbi:MAG: hypothetical protein M3Q79_00720 [bacterium]|nr:hypothetical protein [bacterium]
MIAEAFISEQPQETEGCLGEFDPRIHPELTLQTYESFAGGPERKADREAFANGDTYHLEMTYPELSEEIAADKKHIVKGLRNKAVEAYGAESLTVSSIDYRILETDFLASAARLNALSEGADTEALQAEADKFVELTEALYGKPDQKIVDDMLFDLKKRYTTKDARVQALWEEVEAGFTTHLSDGTEVQVPALIIPTEGEPLPALSEQAAVLLEQEWKLAFPAVVEARGVVGDIIASSEDLDINYKPEDIIFSGIRTAQLFRMAADGIAHQHRSQPFDVIEKENGTTASWDSSRQAIIIGLQRSPEAGKWGPIRKVGVHESMHGLKSSNGLNSGEPAMATGVFSKNPDGSYTDYLTFEEGNNKLGESVVGYIDDEDEILQSRYNLYLMAGLVYGGLNDRQAKEVFGKLVSIERLSLKPELDEKQIEAGTARSSANKVERLFRGTPTTEEVLVDGHKPIFTKDIAYYKGTVIATEFWNGVAESALDLGQTAYDEVIANGENIALAEKQKRLTTREYFRKIFEIQCQGKIDPTNEQQYAEAVAAYDRK